MCGLCICLLCCLQCGSYAEPSTQEFAERRFLGWQCQLHAFAMSVCGQALSDHVAWLCAWNSAGLNVGMWGLSTHLPPSWCHAGTVLDSYRTLNLNHAIKVKWGPTVCQSQGSLGCCGHSYFTKLTDWWQSQTWKPVTAWGAADDGPGHFYAVHCQEANQLWTEEETPDLHLKVRIGVSQVQEEG